MILSSYLELNSSTLKRSIALFYNCYKQKDLIKLTGIEYINFNNKIVVKTLI